MEVMLCFGFVYEINDFVSFYISYVEGFRFNFGFDFNCNVFDFEEIIFFEVGVKWENIVDMFFGSVVIFDVEKINMFIVEFNIGFLVMFGEVES